MVSRGLKHSHICISLQKKSSSKQLQLFPYENQTKTHPQTLLIKIEIRLSDLQNMKII